VKRLLLALIVLACGAAIWVVSSGAFAGEE